MIVHKVPMEGQSPPAVVEPPKPVKLAPPIDEKSAVVDSPVYLRQNSPVEWTAPPGWEQVESQRPTRIVEFTLDKNGPAGRPIQCVLLRGVDEKPEGNKFNVDNWGAYFQNDTAPVQKVWEVNGLKIVKWTYHGRFEGYPVIDMKDPVSEPNWTLYGGWVESPSGSVMFKMLGPDAVLQPNEAKLDALLNSMKPRAKDQ
jgi:hypothetical protein